MTDGLDVIIVDDDPKVCEVLSETVRKFYTWGETLTFSNADKATEYCRNREVGVAIFIVDVFLGGESGFFFLDSIADKFPMVYEDAIIITGYASDDVVNMCLASEINHLLQKPVKPYALQLAVRAIVGKYVTFAKKILQDPNFAESVAGF